MPESAPRIATEDPLLAYVDGELGRRFPPGAMPEQRDQHYRALLRDLRDRVAEASTPEERAFLAQRAGAIAHLRLADARASLDSGKREGAARTSEFGAAVQRLRLRTRLSQSELARRAGIDRAYVHRIERGAIHAPVVPSRNVVLAMAAALRLSAFETDGLLVTAGYAPVALLAAGGWRSEFALLAEFLGDPLLTELDRAEFRQVIGALVAHWRGQRTGQVEARTNV